GARDVAVTKSRLTRGPTAPALEAPPTGRVPLVQRIATASRERPAARSLILSEPGILTAQRAGTTATTLRVACEDPAHVAAGGAGSRVALGAPLRPRRTGHHPRPPPRPAAAATAARDTPVHGHVDIGVQRGGRQDERLAAAGAVAPDRRPRRVLVQ